MLRYKARWLWLVLGVYWGMHYRWRIWKFAAIVRDVRDYRNMYRLNAQEIVDLDEDLRIEGIGGRA